jgi:hypothetical protein
MLTLLELGIIDSVSASLVSINVWKLAEDTLNITSKFLYCNHKVNRDFLITLYDQELCSFKTFRPVMQNEW